MKSSCSIFPTELYTGMRSQSQTNYNNIYIMCNTLLYGGGNRYLHRYGQKHYNTFNILDTYSHTFFHLFTDKPQFKNRPRNIQADSGSHVSIMCDVDSNPPASIEWTFERTKKASVIIIIY